MALYLYAFCRPFDIEPMRGLDGAALRVISTGRLAAVASRFTQAKVRPRRRHLLAHDQAIRALSDGQDILPVSFGTLAASRDELVTLLESNTESIEADLERLEGRIEFAAKARFAVDNVFERFVKVHPELRQARDRMLAEGAGDRQMMMEVGKLFETLRETERERIRSLFTGGLEGSFEEVSSQDPKGEDQVFDLAFLISKDETEDFEQTLYRVAGELDDDLSIHLAGPLPPYSFANLRLAPAQMVV